MYTYICSFKLSSFLDFKWQIINLLIIILQ